MHFQNGWTLGSGADFITTLPMCFQKQSISEDFEKLKLFKMMLWHVAFHRLS